MTADDVDRRFASIGLAMLIGTGLATGSVVWIGGVAFDDIRGTLWVIYMGLWLALLIAKAAYKQLRVAERPDGTESTAP
jgi:hypothetical protein